MYNFEYYGFSLLCYIQRECNSHFRETRETREAKESRAESQKSLSNIREVNRVVNYELRKKKSVSSGRPAIRIVGSGNEDSETQSYIDYSRVDEVAELDLVSKWYPETKRLPSEDVAALGDACYELGLSGVLWQVSQWSPDRKRSVLVMIDDSGPYWSRGRVIAASVSGKSLGLSTEELRKAAIRVTSSQMQNLCIRFNEIRLSKGQK